MHTNQKGSVAVANRNLVEACRLFYKDWLPVNNEALAKIQDGLSSRAYELDEDFFFQDLKSDVSLFTYFLRQARRKCQYELGKTTALDMTPRELFNTLSKEARFDIFDITAKEISPHLLSNAEEFQALQLKEVLVSSSATEALTETQQVDGLLGYSVSSLEQFGRSLIAWNYPKVYAEAIKQEPDPKKLDGTLTGMLGFSPQLLVIALARDWGLSREIRSAVGDQGAKLAPYHPQHEKVQKVSQMLHKLYDVGATLARAQNTEFNPNAEEDWEKAKHAVEAILGPNGMKEIQQKVKDNCYFYLQTAPHIFDSVTSLEPKAVETIRRIPQRAAENRYIRSCPKEARDLLLNLYERLEATQIEKTDAIKELIKGIAPVVGFDRGAVYLLEPESLQLTARLKVGPTPIDLYRPVHAFSVSTRGNNPVGQAYHCNSPIIQSDFTISGEGNTCFASIIGKKQRLGVLYLEPIEKLTRSPEAQLLHRFKALVVAFQDILGIV